MKNQSKTKQALIQELDSLRRRIAELDQSQAKHERVDALPESEKRLRGLNVLQ